MKQIKYYVVVFSLLICNWTKAQNSPAASGGEFLVDAPTGITVTATMVGYGYGWNGTRVIYISSFNTTQGAWDCPKSQKNGLPYMPWGLINFTVKNNGNQIFQFYLDFRDENWATDINSYPSHDTYLVVTLSNGLYTYSLFYGNSQTLPIYNGHSYQIWNVWGVTPITSDFGTPVFVENQFKENSSNLGGTLNVASVPITSGQWAVPPNQSIITVGTNNERFNNIKHQNWNNINNDYLLSRSINVASNPFNEIAIFDDMNYETIEAVLSDNGSNLDSIQFQDPWYEESNGSQPDLFHTFASPYHPTGAYNQSSGGIFLNQPYTGNNPVFYSVRFPSNQTISVGGTNHKLYFQSWTVNSGATVQSNTSNPTAVVFTSASGQVTANVKAAHLSNTSTSFQNNSQRKFVRTPDGTLHLVYESVGHVWYERSTDNGSTWSIANGGKPLDTYGGKLPAIDCQGNNDVVIVWEEAYGGAAEIRVARFPGGTGVMGSYYPITVFVDDNQSYSQNWNPVIAYDYEERATIAWENKGSSVLPIGIALRHGVLGTLYSNPYNWQYDYQTVISGTNSSCFNPTISAAKNPTDQYNMVYNLAWQYNQSSNNYLINAVKITANSGGVTLSSVSNPSSGAGFWNNYNPSIVSMNDNTVRLVWTGYSPWYGYRTVYRYNTTSGT